LMASTATIAMNSNAAMMSPQAHAFLLVDIGLPILG
jgi:hypothetical protein